MHQIQFTLPVGSVVVDRYEIEALLGKGGSGAVYLVRDRRVQQNVFALKELIHPDQHERRQLALEAELLKRTDHSSLPRIYRAFEDVSQGRAYLLMDYIEGLDLEEMRCQRTGERLPLGETLALVGPIVEALAYLHAQQPPIIHRDIKPANIIAPASGGPTVLVDFGIAKEFDQEATTSAIRQATPGYGAPEHYSSGTDERTDIYGLSATIYTLLTGSVPIDAFSRLTQYLSRKSDPLPTVKQLVPELPEHVSEAIERAMTLESDQRFSSVEDFWHALQPATLAGAVSPAVGLALPAFPRRGVAPVPVPLTYGTSSRPSSRIRGRLGFVALLLVVFIALSVGFASAFLAFSNRHAQQAHVPTARPVIHATATATTVPTVTPVPSATPTSVPPATSTSTSPPLPTSNLPTLASTYTGTLHDNLGNLDASMSLDGIAQQQQNIQGNFTVASPLNGSGPFTGTVGSNGSIQFIVHSSDASVTAPLFFSGTMQKNGGMRGTYCSLNSAGQCDPNAGGYGSWSVRSKHGD